MPLRKRRPLAYPIHRTLFYTYLSALEVDSDSSSLIANAALLFSWHIIRRIAGLRATAAAGSDPNHAQPLESSARFVSHHLVAGTMPEECAYIRLGYMELSDISLDCLCQ